ncbi:ORF-17 [Teiidae poxvirus 1]|nr:ORF-17 [Teiidae poxvirus 1]
MAEIIVYKLSQNAKLPVKKSECSAGYDLASAYDYLILPMERGLVLTDLIISIPDGHYGRIAPRSGLAYNHFIDVGAGVLDCDYRGNIGVLLFNFGRLPFRVYRGDRIAQIIFEKIAHPRVVEVSSIEEFDKTQRGTKGFGSTGI